MLADPFSCKMQVREVLTLLQTTAMLICEEAMQSMFFV